MFATIAWAAGAAWASGAELGALEACDDGVGEACRLAAEAYVAGDGVGVDLREAMERYGQACELGSGESCVALGERYQHGDGVREDRAVAAEWFGAGCDLGEAVACRSVGEIHLSGSPAVADREEADRWFRRGCSHGDPPSCMAAAEAVGASGGPPADATDLMRRACDGDLVDGCTAAASRLTRTDPASATTVFAQGCRLGDVVSCRELGLAQSRGRHVKRDREAAREALDMACQADDMAACAGLGALLQRPDPAAALEAASRACGLGSDRSCRRAYKLRGSVQP